MSRLLEKFTYHYREGGLGGLSRKIIDYTRQSLWSSSQWLIYEQTLGDDVLSPRPVVARRELGFRDLVELGYFKALDFPDVIRRRIDSGNVCHGFFEGDRLATIGWTSADYLELDMDVRVPCKGSVGFYDFFTYKEFRSKGYYTNALGQLLGAMHDTGYMKACIAVDPNNVPSIKGIERAGFLQTMRVTRRLRFGTHGISKEEIRNGGS